MQRMPSSNNQGSSEATEAAAKSPNETPKEKLKREREEDAYGRDQYGMLPRLQWLVGSGLLSIGVYAFYFAWSAGKGDVLRIVAIGVVLAGAALLLGFLAGFIFSVPKSSRPTEDQAGAQHATRDPDSRNLTQPNSNLEEISDWLTKILVGAGLVELNNIPGALWRLAGFLAPGLRVCDSNVCVASSQVFALLLMLFNFPAGFLLGYVWTRLYYQRVLDAYQKLLAKERNETRKSKDNESTTEIAYVANSETSGETKKDLERKVVQLEKEVESLKTLATVSANATPGIPSESLEATSSTGSATPSETGAESALQEANEKLSKAIRLVPQNSMAWFERGRVLKKLAQMGGPPANKTLLREALDCALEAARLMPDRGAPLYNAACYQNLMGESPNEVLATLRRSFEINGTLREDARTDPDFVNLRDDENFTNLVKETDKPDQASQDV